MKKLICLDDDCCLMVDTDHNGNFRIGEQVSHDGKKVVLWNE